jgi:hypothetical protein
MKRLLLTISATLMALPASTFAGQVTYSLANDPGGVVTEISSAETSWNGNIDLPKFNASLGTLTGVQFSILGSVFGNIFLANDDSSPATVDSYLGATVTGTLTGLGCTVNCSVDANPLVSFTDNIAAGPYIVSLIPLILNHEVEVFHSEVGSTHEVASSLLTESALLSSLTGTGIFQIAVSATANSGASGGGNLIADLTTFAGAQATVTYFYNEATESAAPEPSTWALIGTSLAGLGLARRRKNL